MMDDFMVILIGECPPKPPRADLPQTPRADLRSALFAIWMWVYLRSGVRVDMVVRVWAEISYRNLTLNS
jgi:hypothetical protein